MMPGSLIKHDLCTIILTVTASAKPLRLGNKKQALLHNPKSKSICLIRAVN